MFRTNVRKALGFAAAALCAAVLAPAQAHAQDNGPYVFAGGGFQHRERAAEDNITYTDWKNGGAFNVGGGYEINHLAVEFEYSWIKNASQTTASAVTGPQPGVGNATLDFFMGNVRYDVPMAGPVTVYVGGGLGAYKSHVNGLSNTVAASFGFFANGTNEGTPFAYQLRGGAKFKLGPHAAVLAGYRYLHGNDLTFLGTAFGDLHPNGVKMHHAEANLQIGF